MLNRIMGAFMFRKGVYEEVAKDTGFTTMAWIIVAVVALLSQFGGQTAQEFAKFDAAGAQIPGSWTAVLVSTVLGTILAIIAFAIKALVLAWVGKLLFKADTNFSEMVRVVGLAYVWNIFGVLGVLVAFSLALACISAPLMFIVAILGLIAMLIGVKAALDLDWIKTIVTVVIGWIIEFLINLFIVGLVVTPVIAMLALSASK